MTARPSDDDLREMLESRASRVSPDTNREAMAGVRAALRGTPDAQGGFAVLPVAIGGRGARLPGGIVAVGLVAVILVAVLGGQLAAPKEASSAGVADSHVPESIPTLAAAGPDQTAVPPEAVPESWTGAELATALGARSIVGQMVVVDGPFTTHLCNPGGSCVVDIDGLEGVRVVFPHALQGVPPLIGPGSRTALRVREDGGVDYLGQIVADAQRPLTVNALAHEYSTPGRALFVVGQLWQRATDDIGMSCPATRPLAPSCVPDGRAWLLADVDPLGSDASRLATGMVVTLGDQFVQGSTPSTAPSTFLVSSLGGGWQVDGIVAATIGQVALTSPSLAPSSGPPVISLPVLGGTLTADELRTRLADGSLDGRLVVIDGQLQLNGRACGLRIACAIPFINGLDGVQIDTDTEARVALQHAIPPPGPLVLVVHDGVLRYLGPQPADVDHPITVSQLLDTRIPSLVDPSSQVHQLTDDLRLVSGWLVIGGPDPSPWLTDDRPSDDGTLNPGDTAGTAVTLIVDPPLQSTDRVVTEGSFLVRDRSRSPAWVDAPVCDASEDVVCSGGEPPIEVVALLGPRSPLHDPLP